jgi:AraC-like DNA-binding protein
LNNSAKFIQIREAARLLLTIAAGDSITQTQLQQLGRYFVGSEAVDEIDSFLELVEVARRDTAVQFSLRTLAERYSHVEPAAGFANEDDAGCFIAEYTEIVGTELLWSQPITLGFARRISGHPFDTIADQSSGLRGWLMLYTVEGSGILDTGVRQLSMTPGHAVLLEPDAVFTYYRDPVTERWGHYWIAFQAASHWRDWLNWPRVGPHIGYLAASTEQRPALERALAALNSNFLETSPMKTELDHNLLEQLILRYRNLLPEQSWAGIDPRIAKAQAFIELHFNRTFSLEEVATAANVSTSGLAHLFKQHTGMTVLSWRDEKRMMRAAQLLRSTRQSITSIAAEVGYVDPPFFTRTFKRLVGQTPRQYRTRI